MLRAQSVFPVHVALAIVASLLLACSRADTGALSFQEPSAVASAEPPKPPPPRACTDATSCGPAEPICDVDRSRCVQCLADSDCKEAPRPVCDRDAGRCIECPRDASCLDAAGPK